MKERDSSAPGSEWSLVCFHLDFDSKANFNAKDTSRMRKILLQARRFSRAHCAMPLAIRPLA